MREKYHGSNMQSCDEEKAIKRGMKKIERIKVLQIDR
jgi:hypothetical protein